jgi:type I restriction enzyme S subunit
MTTKELSQEMPQGWKIQKVSDLFYVKTGTTPSTSQDAYWDGGQIPWITPADMKELDHNIKINRSENKITEKALNEANLTLMPKNSIIISTRAPVGYVGIVDKETTFNQGCKGLIPKDYSKTDPTFYCYLFLRKRKELENASGGSTFKELSKYSLENFELVDPPFIEQKAIASVLSTVDSAIQKSDEAIEKTERLKRGLMECLLTKGIGHTEYNYSEELECGIPKDWGVVALGDVAEINQESCDPSEKPDSSFMYIDIESVENGSGLIKGVKEVFGAAAPSRARRVVHTGDVIMSTVRPYLKAFMLVPHKFDNQICSTGFAVLTATEKTIPDYILYSLFSDNVIDQCNKVMVGGQYPALNSTQVSKIKLPLPPVNEQKKIAEILSAVDEKLNLEKKRRDRLQRIKKGLMDVLLSGKKRVKLGVLTNG